MADLPPTPYPTPGISATDPVVDLRDVEGVDEQIALVPPLPADPAVADVPEQPPEMIGMYYLG